MNTFGSFLRSAFPAHPHFTWKAFGNFLLITLGALLQALSIRLFLVPANLVNGGISGLSQIINHFTGFPIGLMILLGNIPLFIVGWRYLGGPRFALRTAYAVLAISFLVDFLALFLPKDGLTSDLFLNTLYGGVVSGLGYGLVYRGQGTSGGTDILARILNRKWGISISQSYLLTDSLVMFMGGLVFSWTNALYAIVMLYISGVTAEVSSEGSNVVRTAVIITTNPQPVQEMVLINMERGVTVLSGTGAYTGAEKTILYIVVTRSEVAQLKALVREADPGAFIVIGQASEVLGEGFQPLLSS
jgi:uncharacterized membrane-anchored protein YitT (DUF2179 family)